MLRKYKCSKCSARHSKPTGRKCTMADKEKSDMDANGNSGKTLSDANTMDKGTNDGLPATSDQNN